LDESHIWSEPEINEEAHLDESHIWSEPEIIEEESIEDEEKRKEDEEEEDGKSLGTIDEDLAKLRLEENEEDVQTAGEKNNIDEDATTASPAPSASRFESPFPSFTKFNPDAFEEFKFDISERNKTFDWVIFWISSKFC
jgi:hypothetical protein